LNVSKFLILSLKKKEEIKKEKRKKQHVEWNGETWVWAK
jgi:hypothetical protein